MRRVVSGRIVNEGRVFCGSIGIDGDVIADIEEVDAGSAALTPDIYVFPGVIDEHVHFREPGLTEKGDFESESHAAAAGGVTTVFDMPNTLPGTTDRTSLREKLALAHERCLINYAAFIGATDDNLDELSMIDASMVPGIKVFMGASTGNLLVSDDCTLHEIFALAAKRGLPIVAHCEDAEMIKANAARVMEVTGEDAGVELHSQIRDSEVCLSSTRKAIALAEGHGARLMIAHVSTAAELEEIVLHANVKAECCPSYLTFCCQDYARLGALIKCNPAIKNESDRLALRQALGNGGVYCIATDHAPHEMAVKQGGAFKAASGMPSVQFSLTMMLQMADEGWLTLPRVAELMCHHPATYFGVQQRGFIRRGMKADLVIVRHLDEPHTVTNKDVVSKCGWTPYSGMQTRWQVEQTICNGVTVFRLGGRQAAKRAAQQVIFRHDA